MLFKILPLMPFHLPCNQDTNNIVKRQIAPVFGGVNLEDIAAPRCFEIESLLQQLDIPFFTMTSMARRLSPGTLLNALRLVNKSIDKVRIVINGAGAAG